MYVASPCVRRTKRGGTRQSRRRPRETNPLRRALGFGKDVFCGLFDVCAAAEHAIGCQLAAHERCSAEKRSGPIGALSTPRRGVRRDRRRVSARTGGGIDGRDSSRAQSRRAADWMKRRDTYLEALGQGVVTGEVGLEPSLGLDVRASGVLGRLARTAAAAAAIWKEVNCQRRNRASVRRPRGVPSRDGRARSRDRPHRPKKPKRA